MPHTNIIAAMARQKVVITMIGQFQVFIAVNVAKNHFVIIGHVAFK